MGENTNKAHLSQYFFQLNKVTKSFIHAEQQEDEIKFKGECLPSAALFPRVLLHPPNHWLLVVCLCETSTQEMTSLRKVDVSFAHQKKCQEYSQADNAFLSQLTHGFSVKIYKKWQRRKLEP